MKTVTPEQKKEAVAKVDALKAQGVPATLACARLGVSYSGYYAWRQGRSLAPMGIKPAKPPQKRSAPKLLNLPALPPAPVGKRILAFWLNPEDLPSLMKELQ